MPLFILSHGQRCWAGISPKEIYLKEINSRIGALIKRSNEAAIFINEDLEAAIATLENAHFEWVESQSETPILMTEDEVKVIYLSSEISFLGTPENRISGVLKILFHLKRQMDGSTQPIPTFRIDIFSRKYSPMLLTTDSLCRVSLYSLPKSLPSWQREAFLTEFLSLLNVSGFSYSSKGSDRIVWIELKEYSDAGCFGNNQNIVEMSANILDVASLTKLMLAKASEKKCGFKQPNLKHVFKKIFKQLTHDFPECHRPLTNH